MMQTISDILATFHDGGIEGYSGNLSELELKIGCIYLAEKEKEFFYSIFHEMLSLFTKPFHSDTFDFSDPVFFDQIGALGQKYANDSVLREMNGNRGSKHFVYINRTFFGLYNLMFDLKAKDVVINNFQKYCSKATSEQAVLV